MRAFYFDQTYISQIKFISFLLVLVTAAKVIQKLKEKNCVGIEEKKIYIKKNNKKVELSNGEKETEIIFKF